MHPFPTPAMSRLPFRCALLAAIAAPLLLGSPVVHADDTARPQPVSDAVLQQEYADYRNSVTGQKLYTVSYILLADEQAAREQIARLRSGADFAKVAREHSRHPASAASGGALGSFATCRWAKDTLALLDALKPGQIHPKPVKASAGWGIYRLDRVQPVVPISFATYRQQLLSGTFRPECPWVPPVSVGMAR